MFGDYVRQFGPAGMWDRLSQAEQERAEKVFSDLVADHEDRAACGYPVGRLPPHWVALAEWIGLEIDLPTGYIERGYKSGILSRLDPVDRARFSGILVDLRANIPALRDPCMLVPLEWVALAELVGLEVNLSSGCIVGGPCAQVPGVVVGVAACVPASLAMVVRSADLV